MARGPLPPSPLGIVPSLSEELPSGRYPRLGQSHSLA